MNWIDEGFLINKNRYSENSLIAEIYTKDRGKMSGIIFGGTSKKIKNEFESMTSMKSFVNQEDISSIAIYLLSDESKSISGQSISVDGNTERMS